MAIPTTLNGNVSVVQAGGENADEHRLAWSHAGAFGRGALNFDSFKPAWSAGMTLTFGLNASTNDATAYVRSGLDGTMYSVRHVLTNPTIVIDNGSGGGARLDQVILAIQDGQIDGSNGYTGQIQVINGTPAGTVDFYTNRNNSVGAINIAATTQSYIHLCDVLVPANATNLDATKVLDRRTMATKGSLPPIRADGTNGYYDIVNLEPAAGLWQGRIHWQQSTDAMASCNAAALMWLPRRIKASKVMFHYAQGTTANLGNWNLAICDGANGNLISSTGSTAFSGSANSLVHVTQTLNKAAPFSLNTNFHYEVGWYWVWFATGSTVTSGMDMWFDGIKGMPFSADGGNGGMQPSSWNQFIYKTGGGVTFPPANMLQGAAFNDAFMTGNSTDIGSVMFVPKISLTT